MADLPAPGKARALSLVLREYLRTNELQEWQLAHALDVDIGVVHDWCLGLSVPLKHLTDLSFTVGKSVGWIRERERYLEAVLKEDRRLAQQQAAYPNDRDYTLADPPTLLESRRLLADAGLTRTSARGSSVIYYCLSCNRGLGPHGEQRRTRHALAPRDGRCSFCGGSILADECLSGGTDRNPERTAA